MRKYRKPREGRSENEENAKNQAIIDPKAATEMIYAVFSVNK